jgi:primosomal protein N' (replication factor Y)
MTLPATEAAPRPRAARTRRATAGARQPAAALPVARVAVDVSLPHLDRPFDYLVPDELGETAVPGARVRVRFAGRLLDGFVLDRLPTSDHQGRLGFLDRVVSAEPVLAPEIADLARAVADRYAGVLADVLRLAVPPRHARVEAAQPPGPAPAPTAEVADDVVPDDPDPGWARYRAGPAFLDAVTLGRPARAVWQALPGDDWAARLAGAAAAAHAAGRGALLQVPDARDLARLVAALTEVLPADDFTALAADLGPAERYRRFLAVRRGRVRVVAGTRAAAFAPVVRLGLVAMWDDGDDLFTEQRAPYPHAREVLLERSTAHCCALLLGGFARTAEGQLLVESGWAQEISATRAAIRLAAPRISGAGDERAVGADSAAAQARLSPAAFQAARAALDVDAPVLVQVPRRGYRPALACERCRRPSRCRHCHGPLAQPGAHRIPACRWCGVGEAHPRCAACGSDQFRSTVTGSRRTAEELGRAFPGVTVTTSAGDGIKDRIPPGPSIVVATPGAEPAVDGGYGAALLLDGYVLPARPDLRAAAVTRRRWTAAAALVRPAGAGGRVVVGADSGLAVVQALIRWDPAGLAGAELDARRELGFPPAVAMAAIDGTEAAVADALGAIDLPDGAEVLGPVPVDDGPRLARAGRADDGPAARARALFRAPQSRRRALAAALKAFAAASSARKDSESVRIQVDPSQLG